jgi:hypothetical protein
VTAQFLPKRPQKRLLAALLPLLVLRLLIPVGFMPMAGSDGLSIGLCPGDGPLPPTLAHLHHGGQHGGTGGGAHHAPCLFAASAGAALAPAFLALPLSTPPAVPAALPRSDRHSPPSICRAQSPRAPPRSA